jgi:hypothetical protein
VRRYFVPLLVGTSDISIFLPFCISAISIDVHAYHIP